MRPPQRELTQRGDMMYKFYISGVLLPIPPSSLKIQINDKDEEIDLANGGTMSVLNQPGLTTYSFSFRVPNVMYPFAMYDGGFIQAPVFLAALEKMKIGQKPFAFKVFRGDTYVDHRDINTQVSLVEYTINEDAENGGDYIIDIELKEYVRYATYKEITIDKDDSTIEVDKTTERDDVSHVEIVEYYLTQNQYMIQEGDTFQSISQTVFGHMNYAEAIAIHNGLEYTTEELTQVGLVIDLTPEKLEALAVKEDEKKYEEQKGFFETFNEEQRKDREKGQHGLVSSLSNFFGTLGRVYF